MELHRTVAEIAALVQGRVSGPSTRTVARLRAPSVAEPDDLSAVFRAEARRSLAGCRAGTLLVSGRFVEEPSRARTLIRVDDPEVAFDRITAEWGPAVPGPAPGVHPSAVVEADVELGADVAVGPFAFVGAGARLGRGVRLWSHVHVGAGARLGAGTSVQPHAYVGARCVLGERVLVHPGAVIGADGFGFRQDSAGRHHKSPQIGTVEIGDDVEIGANTTIDRARLEVTRIGAGTKIDAQVHIGHNCTVGAHTVIAGQCALGGGATLGDHIMMGGISGIDGRAKVADGTLVAAYTFVKSDTRGGGETVAGIPAVPLTQWKRQVAGVRRLPELIAQVRGLLQRGSHRGA